MTRTHFIVIVLATLVQPAPPRPAPCTAPEHRQFDFWIGEWPVKTPDGKVAGANPQQNLNAGNSRKSIF